MNAAHFYNNNKVPIYLVFAALLVFGIISLFHLDFDLMPDINYPELVVITRYPNASPQEVKNLVSVPIEQACLSLPGVKNVTTESRHGMGIARLRYRWGENLSTCRIELREKLDLLGSFFPRKVKRPIIVDYSPTSTAVAGISVISDSMEHCDLYLLCSKDIKPFVEKTEGVARVDITGGRPPQVNVVVDPGKLVKYNLGLEEVKEVLLSSNKNFPVGKLNDNRYEYLIRVNGEISHYRDLEEIVIKESQKHLVFLKDIARVEYTSRKNSSDVYINGQTALMLSVYKQPGANIIKTADRLDEKLEQLNSRYKDRIYFNKVFDESLYIRGSLKELILAIAMGIFFTVVAVYFFLYNLKLSLLIILTIPASIISTFIVMKIWGLSVNLLTLGGFSLALGMIVDNAVIVTYAVYDCLVRKAPVSMKKASGSVMDTSPDKQFFNKVSQVIPPVVSATLTTVVVFFPVLFLSGVLKVIFMQLSLVIIFSLLFSLLLSVTVIPLMLSRIQITTNRVHVLARINKFIECCYRRMLMAVFARKRVCIGMLGGVVLLGVFSYRLVDKCFIESVPQDYFFLKMVIKTQVCFDYTVRFTKYVSSLIEKDRGVKTVVGVVGSTESLLGSGGSTLSANTSILSIYINEGNNIDELTQRIRRQLKEFTDVSFVFSYPSNPIQKLLVSSNFDILLKIFDPSVKLLTSKTNMVHSFLVNRGLAEDVQSSYYTQNTESSFLFYRERMPIFNMDPVYLGEFVSAAVSGIHAGTWRKEQYDIPIVLKFPEEGYSDVEDLLNFKMKNRDGKEIPLSEVLYVQEDAAPGIILRENQTTFSRIEFNLKQNEHRWFQGQTIWPGGKSSIHQEVKSFLASQGLRFRYLDQFFLLRESYSELFLSLFLALFLEYVILASMFRSFSRPLLVIFMVPVSITGIFIVLLLVQASLNINTFMSIIVLVGLMVNNAIMLFAEFSASGAGDQESIIAASVRRLKPILITTMTTILALSPTLFTGSSIQVNLAATLMLGLMYSTGITLIFLPLFYSMCYGNPGLRKPEIVSRN
ncbi:MAG: efflux RND transporter permease subunit [Spirochaetota bacterium]